MSQAYFSPGSETEALSLFRKGNKESFGQLYDRYAPVLFGIICRIIPDNPKCASRALEQSFIYIWQNRNSFHPGKERLFTWMSRNVRRITLNVAEIAESVENNSQNENQNSDFYVNNHGKINPAVTAAFSRGTTEKEGELLDKALELIYVHGKSLQEASQFLNMAPELIRSGLKGAVNRLKVKAVV